MRSFCRYIIAGLLLVAAGPWMILADDLADLETREERAFRAAVDRVAPSVVAIETVGGSQRVGKILFGTGPTTGLIVDPDGYLVSSAFAFLNRPESILVRLPDGSRRAARLVATDHNRMLTLLKIETDAPLPVAEIAPKHEMRVGQWTIAVGRTFDPDAPNMAVGILSARNRIWGKAIQTDAAVSPNNYGGPLIDIRGRIMGVLAPLSPEKTEEIAGVEWYDSGIGFAIPAEEIQAILPRLIEGEDLYPGHTGLSFGKTGLYTGGPIVEKCWPKSPAEKAGIQPGDKIVEIDGREVTRAAEVKEAISRRYAGETITLVLQREDRRVENRLELVDKLPPLPKPDPPTKKSTKSDRPGDEKPSEEKES